MRRLNRRAARWHGALGWRGGGCSKTDAEWTTPPPPSVVRVIFMTAQVATLASARARSLLRLRRAACSPQSSSANMQR